MPGPDNQRSELVQDIYPYAEPTPVTYMAPGQRFWTTERTHGGWYVTSFEPLKEQLVAAGLPATAPAVGSDGGSGDEFPWIIVGVLAALGVIALVALTATGRRHRTAAAS